MKRLILCFFIVLPALLPLESFVVQPAPEQIAADTLCFTRDILPIFNSNCAMTGCHDATTRRSGYNLTTYSGVMSGVKANSASASRFYSIMNGSMPQYPWKAVPDSLKARIATWINSGAKNTTCANEASCDTSNVTYLKDIKPILQASCVGCHQTSNALGSFHLDVDADNITNKVQIYNAAAHLSSIMPKNLATGLSSCQLAKVRVWALGINDVSNDASSDDSFRVIENNGEELLRFQLNNATNATIAMYGADGRILMSIPDKNYNSGLNEVQLNTSQLTHGLYFVRFMSGSNVRSLKFLR